MESPAIEVLVFLIVSLPVVVALYRRFRRTAGAVPWTCQAAAAIALSWGVVTALAGIGHSLAVASVALSEREYGNLQILWFTTGAMLLYVGTMNASLYRAIKMGQRPAIAVSVATTALFLFYMLLHYPMPGNAGTAEPMFWLWAVYMLWVVVAGVSSRRAAVDRPERDELTSLSALE